MKSENYIIVAGCSRFGDNIASILSKEGKDVIIIDIGGRTTDIAYISNKKHQLSDTVAVGTLNIYKEVATKLNSEYSLDLDIQKVDRITERGTLKVDNKDVDLRFITEILKKNFMRIKETLDFNFPARTENIILTGGGAKLFIKAFKNRYSNCDIADEPLYTNQYFFGSQMLVCPITKKKNIVMLLQ